MKEKTKKILKGVGLGLGSIAILALGVGIGACSVKNGSAQPVTTTPIRKGLNQKPNKAPNLDGTYNLIEDIHEVNGVWYEPSGDGLTFSSNNWGGSCGYFYRSELPSGYYYVGVRNSDIWCLGTGVDSSYLSDIEDLSSTLSGQIRSVLVESRRDVVNSNQNSYFYLDWSLLSSSDVLFFRGIQYLYLVDTLEMASEDILELPVNWSPLRMVAKNVNKENNLIFDTDWNNWVDVPEANGQSMLDLSTILFRNQGRVYNHIYIYFKNLNGLKYATNSENIGTGTVTDWCADRVEYALVIDNSLKHNYLASSVGTSILQGQSVYNLGLNWSNSNARKLEILDKRYPNDIAINNTLHGRFPRTPTSAHDPVTNQIIRPFGFGVWDYEYLFEYSNITSVDFILGGSSDVFGIFTNAFNSVLPILSVQVLPNLTLGILLFLPLIGGIIVVIIRVIKK